MVRKMVKMELIKKEKSLLVTYNKRKTNLLRKASEFSILCGIDACVVVFGPTQNNQPQTWPLDPYEVDRIIRRYKQSDQPRKLCSLSDYFADKKKKVDSEIVKLSKQNYKAKYPPWHDCLNGFLEEQLRLFAAQLEEKLEFAERKLEKLRGDQYLVGKFDSGGIECSSRMGCQNTGYDSRGFTNLLLLSDDPKIPDVHEPVRFQPQQSSNMNDSGYATNLQLFCDPNAFDVRVPGSYGVPVNQNLMDSVMINVLNHQNNRNQFRGTYQYIPQSGPSYVNPGYGMRDNNNLMFCNANSSMSFSEPAVQPMLLPHMQFPLPSFPYQLNEFNSNLQAEENGQKWE